MKKLKKLIKEWSTDMGREFVRGNNCLKNTWRNVQYLQRSNQCKLKLKLL